MPSLHRLLLRSVPLGVAFAAISTSLASAQFVVRNELLPTGPGVNSATEDVDFGDVDNDGDWDVASADGGDSGNDQNRLWVNKGGIQGGTLGLFDDVTNAQMPALEDTSRDIEMADIDMDGDLDMHTSNTSSVANQGNRWLINSGGEQGGSLGFFQDDTHSRWIGLGTAGSSIAPSLLLTDTFVTWSHDSDFADADNDGDLDLLHSTYGSGFGGQTPTRLFLNDGQGYFEEFNPSGFQLPTINITNGQPGIWCEGTQLNATLNSTGLTCDIATAASDVEWGDIDGDLDLDILLGDRGDDPRVFHNRLAELGQLGFRDVTHAVLPTDYAPGTSHYEQELGDLDNDGDLDLYGLDWDGFSDVSFTNDGTGVFTNKLVAPNSGDDTSDGDLFDFDNDGDLDVFVANFSGGDDLYRNEFVETGSPTFTPVGKIPAYDSVSTDADACDLDGDGDYDILIAEDLHKQNTYLENVSQVPDTTAPALYRLEDVSSGAASDEPDVVRVQVYDNAPVYITWYNPSQLIVSVDGVELPSIPMRSSGGQIFRGEIPGNLVGNVAYRAVSTDAYGNAGQTPPKAYTQTGDTGTLAGASSPSSQGGPITLRSLTAPMPQRPLHLLAGNAAPGSLGALAFSFSTSAAVDLGDGLILNLGLPLVGDLIVGLANSNGETLLSFPSAPASLAGTTLHAQFVSTDGAAPSAFASSQRLELTF